MRLGVGDLPPSVNLLRTVRHLFEGAGYRIGGSAFDDERLARIYMSYRNPSDYRPAWNWGRLGRIAVRGRWSNVRDLVAADDVFRPLHGDMGRIDAHHVYAGLMKRAYELRIAPAVRDRCNYFSPSIIHI